MAKLAQDRIARVPGTAVFLTRSLRDTPPMVAWYVKHSGSLHECVVALTVLTETTPRVAESARLSIEPVAPNFWRVQGALWIHGAPRYSPPAGQPEGAVRSGRPERSHLLSGP